MSSANRTPLKDRGWSWPSLLASSVVVGVSLAAMTYYAWSDGRGSIIFGSLMCVGWLAAFAVAKVVRERGESPNGGDVTRWLHGSWERLSLAILLSLVAIFTALSLVVGQDGLALIGLLLAIPPAVTLGVGIAGKRR